MAMLDRGRVLVTRSAPGAELLARALRGARFKALVMPMIEVVAISNVDAMRHRGWLKDGDAVVFLSVHAVAHGFPLLDTERLPADLSWVGVGAATCDALQMRGIHAMAPDDERSEGILAMEVLAAARRVLLIGGEGGRRELDSTLAARGAEVERIEVYQRRATQVTLPVDLSQFAYVIVSSVAGGEVLIERAKRLTASAKPVFVVPSDRVAARMRELGVARVIVSRGASAAAVVNAIEENEDRDE